MVAFIPDDFNALYAGFDAPITALDCGQKCAPYNERGVPFCCDTRHAVPTAYGAEWQYLELHTDLWHVWQGENEAETARLQNQTPPGQALIECQGHLRCQRGYRAITCRAFPFFPYISEQGEFLGLTFYWEYEDRCWVISHLDVVTPAYLAQFIAAYEAIFAAQPEEWENFSHHAAVQRDIFSKRRRAIILLHRDGEIYKITPHSGRMRRTHPAQLPKFGPYLLAAQLPFPDEL